MAMADSNFDVIPVPVPLMQHMGETDDEIFIDRVVSGVDRQLRLSSHTSRPYAIYGHSMGAAVAHTLTTRLDSSLRRPRLLVVGACLPPHVTTPVIDETASDERLTTFLHTVNGTPLALQPRAIERILLPRLRAGLRFVRVWRKISASTPLRTPLGAIFGADDRWSAPSAGSQWAAYSDQFVGSVTVGGPHLFHQSPGSLLDALDRLLATERAVEHVA